MRRRVLSKTVLLVEDDAELRTVFRVALKNAGYRVIDVEDGGDALRQVEREIPSAVVLDLGLPRVSGRDVQRELAAGKTTRRIPIIAVTGTPTDDLDLKGFAAILCKPVPAATVVDVVDQVLKDKAGRLSFPRS